MTATLRVVRIQLFAVLIPLLTALPASAQSSVPVVSVGVAAGVAFPFHADFDFTAAAWEATVRVRSSSHMTFEVLWQQWWHSDTEVFLDVPIQTSTGSVGRVDQITQTTGRRMSDLGVNVLGRQDVGRVSVFGGGGVGIRTFRRVFDRTLTGCSSSLAGSCEPTTNVFRNADFVFLAGGGMDWRIASHIAGSVDVRLGVPVSDAAGGDLRVVAGVRIGL